MNIEERLTRIEAYLFGKAEQTEKPKFEAFYVDCTKEEYSEVKRILEAQGYVLYGEEWVAGEDCVTTTDDGEYMTYAMALRDDNQPVYTLPQLREKFGVEQPQEKLRDFVVPLAHATLTREEVAARCIAAAEKKGYKADPSPHFGRLHDDRTHVTFCSDGIYVFHNHDCQNTRPNTLTTLEAFEEYCGVEQPLPSGNSEKPNSHEPAVYEAGFWFGGEHQFLKLPDLTTLWLSSKTQVWRKTEYLVDESGLHPLTPVSKHTVGKFYAVAGMEQNRLNDWNSYALCVGEGEFVRPQLSTKSLVSVYFLPPQFVSQLEVTPI